MTPAADQSDIIHNHLTVNVTVKGRGNEQPNQWSTETNTSTKHEKAARNKSDTK